MDNGAGDYLHHIGYHILGPVLFEFCRWLHEQKQEDRLLFLSREGEFVKQCYDLMYPQNEARILYLSRKAVVQGTAYVLLGKCSIEEFCLMIRFDRYERIEQVFRRLGLNAQKYVKELNLYGLSPKDKYSYKMKPFFERYHNLLLADMSACHELFTEYLSKNLEQQNVLVDIGWEGRMQNLLCRYLELIQSKIKIKGLYLGIKSNKERQGFLFEGNGKLCQDVLCFSGLLEVLMMPHHGSTIGYKREGAEVMPIFDTLEFTQTAYRKIEQVQNGIKDFVRGHTPVLPEQSFEKEAVINRMVHFGCHPDKRALQELGMLELYENGEKHCLIGDISWRNLKDLPEAFLYSKWKAGFLKKLFYFDLPYEQLIGWLRRKAEGGVLTSSAVFSRIGYVDLVESGVA